MTDECHFSFDDLFEASHHRAMSDAERTGFHAAPQDERNRLVRRWVEETEGAFTCEDRIGTDGVTYAAFWAVEPRRV